MNESFLQFCKLHARIAASVVIAVGCVALIGIVFRSESLQTGFIGPVGMKANTACCFVLVGVALSLRTLGAPPSRQVRIAIHVLSAVAALVGGLTLLQHLTGANFGIDELLFKDRSNMLATSSPGRMGPPASIGFLLAGSALMLLSTGERKRVAVAQVLALFILFIALVALIGHAYDVRPLYQISRVTGIAANSAICLMLIATGLLAARPTSGPMALLARDDAGGAMSRRLIAPAVVIPFVLGWLRTVAERREWIDAALGRPLLIVSLIVSLVALIWWNARALSALGQSRTLAEMARQEAERRYRAVFEATTDGLIVNDSTGRVIEVNEAASRMHGYTKAEFLTVPPTKFIHAPDLPLFAQFIEKTTRGEDFSCEARDVRKDGSLFPVEVRGMSFIFNDRRYVLGVVRDITERRRAEQERERLLENERAARTEAEHASRLKDEFLSTVSHELRTPLNAILGWSHIIRQSRAESDDTRQGIEVIERNARVQAQIIEDLLDMSRIVSGKLRLHVQDVDLTTVIEAAIETVQPAANAKRITIVRSIETDPSPLVLACDADRLQQVVWNLLSNAIKFTADGGHIDIRARRSSGSIELLVADDGQGIEADFLPLVFDKFRQADGSASRKHGGLGLGLAIVKHLVELHGGSVSAASEGAGRGATFTVTLPMQSNPAGARFEDRPQRTALHDDKPLDGDWPQLRGVSVLVVDDEPDARELTRRLLADCEANVVLAESAHEALVALDAHRIDVLVCDIGMPGTNGYELIRTIRDHAPDNLRHVPAVALTAFARSEDRTRAIMAGFQTHLAKPVVPVELLFTVANLAGKTAGHRID